MSRFTLFAYLFIALIVAIASPFRFAAQTVSSASRKPTTVTASNSGEKIFAANCARCHQAPMALPPRITGTILMHMRVRARLSASDERQILRYLAP